MVLVRDTKGRLDMPTHQQHTTAAEDRVSWSQLIAYGMGGLIPVALFNIAGQLMGLLGNISLGLSAFWLGTIMIIPRLWDALSDPIIGHLSDNTRTRWGRRRPYILVGGIAVALSFVAMWWVPRGEWIREIFPSDAAYNWFQLLFILAGLLVFFTACTIFEIPHGALGMEMSGDYHERTRLFSAKSFLGNLFAMGTPWLIFLAGLEFFRGNGDLTDGMRYVSMFIAAAVIPMAIWWFVVLKEPRLVPVEAAKKPDFWSSMEGTVTNLTFVKLIGIIFTLAMGFNFVNLFSYYIAIFYLYDGDAVAAGHLLGWNGTVWATTALFAVFPLNWLSRRLGKNRTLLIAILLMCAAQLAKIFCYRRGILYQSVLELFGYSWPITIEGPYLVFIPTMLLSAGMLMFFTLGSSMVGDVCDEDELQTGTRSEGSYYSVFWWFIKMGTAFASFVTGALLVYTSFDETQNVAADAFSTSVAAMKAEAELWVTQEENSANRIAKFAQQIDRVIDNADRLRAHFVNRIFDHPSQAEHVGSLINRIHKISDSANALRAQGAHFAAAPNDLIAEVDKLLEQTALLKRQAPTTLFRLRLVEIGLPLVLSIVSIWLTLRYPLTEARCYEIKEALKRRRAEAIG